VAAGLRPEHLHVPFDPDVESGGLLVRAARPVLDQLAADLAGAPVAVLLTNERGQVVDRRAGDPWLLARLDRVRLAPGYVYAEDAVGTNGLGTALSQRSPATVEGEEHFADALTTVACAGAPIDDPRSGRVLGVIALTSLAGEGSALMLPLATRAAREIEQRIVEAGRVTERLVIQRFLQERRGAKGPLVFLTERSMLTNAAADRLVEPQDEPLLRKCADRLADAGLGHASHLVLSAGTEVAVRSDPIPDGGPVVGSVLRLTTTDARANSRAMRGPVGFGWESLTETERSVTELVVQGFSNREAAERLFLSHHTVGFHLRSIYRKLAVSSRVDLTRLAIEHVVSIAARGGGGDASTMPGT
jgi:DNA-binding CsgD family transcriptional regulator